LRDLGAKTQLALYRFRDEQAAIGKSLRAVCRGDDVHRLGGLVVAVVLATVSRNLAGKQRIQKQARR
jgi:hypothetical protein